MCISFNLFLNRSTDYIQHLTKTESKVKVAGKQKNINLAFPVSSSYPLSVFHSNKSAKKKHQMLC